MALATSLPTRMALSSGTVYFCGSGGDDTRSAAQAQSTSTPWLTIQNAVTKAYAVNATGNFIIKLKTDRTYAESINLSNVRPANPWTVTANYTTSPGDLGVLASVTRQIKTTNCDMDRWSYLSLDGGSGGGAVGGVFKIGPTGVMNTASISSSSVGRSELDHCEIKNWQGGGIYAGGTAATFNTEDVNDWHVTNCWLHANGRGVTNSLPGQDHAAYFAHGYRFFMANCRVEDNPSGNGIQLYPEANGCLITGCTFIANMRNGIVVGGDANTYLAASNTYGIGAVRRPSSNNLIRNCVISNHPGTLTGSQNPGGFGHGYAVDTFWGGSTGSGNTVDKCVHWHNGTSDTATSSGGMTFTSVTVADPLYVATTDSATGDNGASILRKASAPAGGTVWDGPNHDGRNIHLTASSPALGLATDVYLPVLDYDNVSRAGLTVGVYESSAPPPPPPTVPVNTVLPALTGTTSVGQTLTCSAGAWTGAGITYTYQWLKDTLADSVYADIVGSTGATYVPAAGDLASNVRCKVTATNTSGAAAVFTSPAGPITKLGRTVTARTVGGTRTAGTKTPGHGGGGI